MTQILVVVVPIVLSQNWTLEEARFVMIDVDNHQVLPSGNSLESEGLEQAACRILKMTTNLSSDPSHVQKLGSYEVGNGSGQVVYFFASYHQGKLLDLKGEALNLQIAFTKARDVITTCAVLLAVNQFPAA